MRVLINEEKLAFLRTGLQQVKVEFTIVWKKLPDLQNLIENPKYIYLLHRV